MRGFYDPVPKLTRSAFYLMLQQPCWVVESAGLRTCHHSTSGDSDRPSSQQENHLRDRQRDYGIPGISVEDLIKDPRRTRKLHRGTSLAEMRYDPAMSRYLRTRLDDMYLTNGAALDGFPATRMS